MASQSSPAPQPIRTSFDWTARIRCIESQLGTNFSVLIFLGPVALPPEDPKQSPHYLGSFDTFFTPAYVDGSSQTATEGPVVQGFVNLTHALINQAGLGSLRPDVIVPYLKDHLSWSIEVRMQP